MNKILLALALLGVVNLVYCVNYPQTPAGFRNLDNYGTDFVTRKTYYRSNALGVKLFLINFYQKNY